MGRRRPSRSHKAKNAGGGIWDIWIPVGIATILLLWKEDIVTWWGKHYTPTSPTCIPVSTMLSEANVGAAIMFAIVAGCAYLYIRGQRRLLRAVRFSAFAGIVVCLLRGVHVIEFRSSTVLPEGFAHALGKFDAWLVTVGLGAILALFAFFCLVGALFNQTRKQDWESLALSINAFAFLELEWAARVVKRWGDVSFLALLGAVAALFELMFYIRPMSRFALAIIAVIGVLWYTFVGITGYRLFLAAWGPQLCR